MSVNPTPAADVVDWPADPRLRALLTRLPLPPAAPPARRPPSPSPSRETKVAIDLPQRPLSPLLLLRRRAAPGRPEPAAAAAVARASRAPPLLLRVCAPRAHSQLCCLL